MRFSASGLLAQIGPWMRDLRTTIWQAILDFPRDRCTQWAAAMSYYVLFSLFPLVIVIVSVASLFVSKSYVRDEAVQLIGENVGLTADGREEIVSLLDRAVDGLGAIGLIGLVGLVWSASAMMSAMRNAVNAAWDVEERRHFVRGKALDLLLVLALFLLFSLSVGLTFVVRFLDRIRASVTDEAGVLGSVSDGFLNGATRLSPLVISFVSFLLIYRFIPAVRTRFRDVWIGALIASVLFEGAKISLTFYFANFGNYDEVYGSLGAVISFLLFVWIAGLILLLGAEVAAEWPRVRAGAYDDERFADDGESFLAGLRSWLRGEATRAIAPKPVQEAVRKQRNGDEERADEDGPESTPERAGASSADDPGSR